MLTERKSAVFDKCVSRVQIVYLFTLLVCKLPRVHMQLYTSKFGRFCGKTQTFSFILIKCECTTPSAHFRYIPHTAIHRRCFPASICAPQRYPVYRERSSPDVLTFHHGNINNRRTKLCSTHKITRYWLWNYS